MYCAYFNMNAKLDRKPYNPFRIVRLKLAALITTPRFLAAADVFVSLPRIKHGELFKNFSR